MRTQFGEVLKSFQSTGIPKQAPIQHGNKAMPGMLDLHVLTTVLPIQLYSPQPT